MVDQYFDNNSLEPFESIFIGSTGLTMAFIWLLAIGGGLWHRAKAVAICRFSDILLRAQSEDGEEVFLIWDCTIRFVWYLPMSISPEYFGKERIGA